jgi:hypothetical protein
MNDIEDLKPLIQKLIKDDADWFIEKNIRPTTDREMVEDYVEKYARMAARRINKAVLERYGHRLSRKALETAYALSGDGWNLGPYELLETAQRLTQD